MDALRVAPEKDIHAVPGPLGDLCRRDGGTQPSRHCCGAAFQDKEVPDLRRSYTSRPRSQLPKLEDFVAQD